MLLMPDRRAPEERRSPPKIPEQLERQRERRESDDRRECARVACRLWVRELEEGALFEPHDGDVSLFGVGWSSPASPVGRRVEVKFRLPGRPQEFRSKGTIVGLRKAASGIARHVRLDEMDAWSELELARFIEGVMAAST
jgi:hypothetical protein